MRNYCFYFLLFFAAHILAQNQGKDSAEVDFEKLKDQFFDAFEVNDSVAADSIALVFLNTAKKHDPNSINHIQGHVYLSFLSDFELANAHLDTVVEISKNIKDRTKYPGMAHFYRANLYYEKQDWDTALTHYLTALEFLKDSENEYYANLTNYNIALIKLVGIGQEREAIELFKECEVFFEVEEHKSKHKFDYLALLYNYSETYRRLNLIDSSAYYTHQGLNESKRLDDRDFLKYFEFSKGINAYLKSRPREALKLISEPEGVIRRYGDFSNLALLKYYKGMIFKDLNEADLSLVNFLELDSILELHSVYSIETRKGIEELIKYYRNNKNLPKELEYVKKLMRMDSAHYSDYEKLVRTMNIEYDNRDLLANRNELIHKLDIARSSSNKKSAFLVVLLIILLTISAYFFRKQRKLKKQFDELMTSKPTEVAPKNESRDKLIDIKDEIVDAILINLQRFEDNYGFVQRDLNSQRLSKELKTNTKYLSKVINAKKGKSIVNYINDLRVDYSIEKLKNDEVFRRYTIDSIAKDVGFSNATSFAQAFQKRTNLKPSFFVKKLLKTTANSANL